MILDLRVLVGDIDAADDGAGDAERESSTSTSDGPRLLLPRRGSGGSALTVGPEWPRIPGPACAALKGESIGAVPP